VIVSDEQNIGTEFVGAFESAKFFMERVDGHHDFLTKLVFDCDFEKGLSKELDKHMFLRV
jgi:hypothetical protein